MKTGLVYRFGNFTLDVANRQLTREEIPIPLTPKVFETLQVLIEHAGQLVPKEELMRSVWQDRFVEESNLTFNIKMLRKALGDDAGQPRYIETVPRHGYRFIAETSRVLKNRSASLGDAPVAEAEGAVAHMSQGGFRTFVVFGSIMFVAAVTVVVWVLSTNAFQSSAKQLPFLSSSARWETLSNSGSVFYPRVSPDGRYLAYTTREAGTQTMWLKELASGTNLPIMQVSTDEILGLMFSRNSDFVYFVRKPAGAEQEQAAIYRISIFGGIPTRLVTNTQGWFSISSVDDRIAFVRFDADRQSVVVIADADGRSERVVAARERPVNFRANRWSPDGKKLAAAVGHTNNLGLDFGVVEIDVESATEREITAQKFEYISDIEWADEGRVLITARGSQSPHNQLWQLSLGDQVATKVIDDGRSYSTLSFSRDAGVVAVSESVPDFKLHVERLGGSSKNVAVAASPSIFNFTPGGKIVYAAAKGQTDVWVMNTDGSNQKQLTADPAYDFHALPSPDEKYIFFVSTRSGDAQIWRIGTDGSDPVRITKEVGGFPIFVSPDATTLYYLSALDRTIWSVGVDGGNENPFLDQRTLFPAFSPDGRYLAYFFRDTADSNRFRLVVAATHNFADQSTFTLADEASSPVEIAWSPDGLSLYYGSESTAGAAIWRQAISASSPEKIKALTDPELVDLAVSPNTDEIAWLSGRYRREARLHAK
ncbi:MAG TPA: winged helix-turn-helix domain-containing protein [Pyrinomonadaceae bacterium]|nr:winged helix-turn-helix domain-containing protein [Pyrinomonadaceae bacterium]